jgi:hypothetical protein
MINGYNKPKQGENDFHKKEIKVRMIYEIPGNL